MTAEYIARFTILIGCVVLGLKTAAWWVTGSVALYSDALESIVNVAASVVALIALRIAARPADANHPYGHDKAEFFAATIEGVLIVLAALSIFDRAWDALLHPRAVEAPLVGLALNGAATALNGAWAVVLLRAGRRLRSPTLNADGMHLMSDVITSVGVAAGVTAAVVTGYVILDPIVAGLTGVYICWAGISMVSRSAAGLMDAAPDAAIVTHIRQIVAEAATGAIEVHDLRTRQAGRINFLDFHLVVPGAMTVSESHQICDRIEDALRAEMGHLIVTIHVEPEEKAKHRGVPVL
jgi:cation diffusion facilitator family transporter